MMSEENKNENFSTLSEFSTTEKTVQIFSKSCICVLLLNTLSTTSGNFFFFFFWYLITEYRIIEFCYINQNLEFYGEQKFFAILSVRLYETKQEVISYDAKIGKRLL